MNCGSSNAARSGFERSEITWSALLALRLEDQMNGMQKTAYEAVMEVACKILDGAYGKDDDLDVEALEEDLDNATADLG